MKKPKSSKDIHELIPRVAYVSDILTQWLHDWDLSVEEREIIGELRRHTENGVKDLAKLRDSLTASPSASTRAPPAANQGRIARLEELARRVK